MQAVMATFDAGRYAVLEGIARGTPLRDALDGVARLLEGQRPGMLAAILLVDRDHHCLRVGAAPNLPESYVRLLDGHPIGPKHGSCGTAAYLGQRVIVEDLAVHPYWEGFAEPALAHGLRACWATPIVGADRGVIGTFAIYYREPRTPSPDELAWVDAASSLAAIAIVRDASDRAVRWGDARYRQLIDTSHEGYWTVDTARLTTFVNRRMGEILGEDPAELLGKRLIEYVHPDDRQKVTDAVSRGMSGTSDQLEFRIRRSDGSERWVISGVSAITDEAGHLAGGFGMVRDITARRVAEMRAERIARLYAVSSAVNEAIVRIREPQRLYEAACRIAVEEGLATSACIGVRNPEGDLVTVAEFGDQLGPAPTADVLSPPGRCSDSDSDAERASFTLTVGGQPWGIFTILGARESAFGDEELRVLSALADDIAFAIESWQTQQDHRRLEARVSASLDQIHDPFYTVDPEWRFTYCNLAAERAAGKPRAELLGKVIWDEFPEMVGTIVEESFRRAVASQTPVAFESFYKQLGSWVDIRVHPSPDGLAVYARNIDDTRKAAERLREQASLLDHARDAIFVRDMDYRVTYWNQGAERLYGWTAEEAVGRTTTELLSPEADVANARQQFAETGAWDGEIVRRAKNGRELTVLGHWTLVSDKEGRPKSCLVIESDVTARKVLEQQFLRAQRLESIGTLAGGIAHDLNNVLTPISMAIEILKSKVNDQAGRDMLGILAESAAHGTNMVKQVLSFARGVEGARIQIDTAHLLKDVERISRDTFPKSIRTQMVVSPDVWSIEGDPTQIHQVLLNLCVNARDAMPNGGELTLRAENRMLDAHYVAMNNEAHAGPYVMLSVEDTGAGIPVEARDKIFDPFFTTKQAGKGTGLGLSTCMTIVRSHGGFIRVYSEVARGTRFAVYLPATVESVSAAVEAPVALPRGHGEMVLVVDDELSIRRITEQTLVAFGYRVLVAAEGAEAVALFAQHHDEIAVVLMDMTMPTMDGASAIRVMERIAPGVPVIAASGIAANESTALAAGSNVKFFLAKPYTADTVLDMIRRVLPSR